MKYGFQNDLLDQPCVLRTTSHTRHIFVGLPSIGKSIALRITPFELCELVWFPWQQIMHFKTVGYVPTNYLYHSRNSS